jgi:hypothetical protein
MGMIVGVQPAITTRWAGSWGGSARLSDLGASRELEAREANMQLRREWRLA